ncbi:MAG: HAMP domain-containing histidine kinase [bacterium]|nr:HAMP domain-containing histidine kinase [bacterium]
MHEDPLHPIEGGPRIRFSWLLRLRWAAALGQMLAVGVARWGFGLPLPLAPLGALVATTVVSNLAMLWWMQRGGRATEAHAGSLLTLDLAILTGLLYWSGGPSNPFTFLYLVYLTLAAAVLPGVWTWSLAALAVCGFGVLFVSHVPLSEPFTAHGVHDGEGFQLHLYGMWIAFTLATLLIAFFVTRVSDELRRHQAELAEARERGVRIERLAALASLAAGTAHELGTPLATIAVVAKELERNLASDPSGAPLLEEALLIRSEVDRCRTILDQMSIDAGENPTESIECLMLADLIEELHAELGEDLWSRLDVTLEAAPEAEEDGMAVRAPRRALVRSLVSLLRNGFDASPVGAKVRLAARREGATLILVIEDFGTGVSPEVMRKMGEPFFTTKPPGRGQGLGLFLARTLAEQMGGALRIDSEPGHGTRAILELPIAMAETGATGE